MGPSGVCVKIFVSVQLSAVSGQLSALIVHLRLAAKKTALGMPWF
jgi:hypothetical protein